MLLYLKFKGVLPIKYYCILLPIVPAGDRGNRSKEWEKAKTQRTLHSPCRASWLVAASTWEKGHLFLISTKLSYRLMVALAELQVIQTLGKI